jgi:two-component system sensor kinase FixL
MLEEVLPALAPQLLPLVRQVVDTQQPIFGVEMAEPESTEIGPNRRWLLTAQPTKDDSGKVQRISIVVQDITAYRIVQEELLTTHEYLDTVLLNLPVGVAILEAPDFRYYRINHKLAEINGLSVEDHLDRALAEVLPDAAADIEPGLRHVLETGEPSLDREFSTRLPKDPGVIRHFIDSFFPIKGTDGKAKAVGAVVLDITARKEAEEALQRSYSELEQRVKKRTAQLTQSNVALHQEVAERQKVEDALRRSETRLTDIVDIAADAIISIDSTQQIIHFNKAAETTFGYPADEIIGQSFEVLIPQRYWVDHRKHVTAFLGSAQSSRRMAARLGIQGRRNNGEEFPAEASISKIEAAGQHIFTVVLRDISERKQAEEALRQQRAELARVLRMTMMSELTATLAHELNQPLTAIRSNAEAGKRFMSADVPDLEEIGEILDDIIDDNRRAAEVIRHMRALLSKREADTHPLDINELIGEVITIVHSDSVARNVTVDLDLADGLPLVPGDRVQLQQVCLNLILNGFDALQDIPVDERRILVSTAWQDEKTVCISMRDTGIGFSGQDADRLFEAFHTTKATGLGMGLAISRSIIKAHGGKIWASENPDRGATFQFTLPLLAESEPQKDS